jgi:glutamate racemase
MAEKNLTPIGVFDSGYGGLTILKEFIRRMPEYDFIYLGDNARAPYGSRSFEVVYRYTLEAVNKLFAMGCPLIILACNTASAKALRNIQQNNLPLIDPSRRVLGVIRPSVEVVDQYTLTKHIGVLGTIGTVKSESYKIEIRKLFPGLTVVQEACPLWVPIVEHDEINTPGADYFVKKNIDQLLSRDPLIDTILLGCTHYPLLLHIIEKHLPAGIKAIPQDKIAAESLIDYLHRHPEMDRRISKNRSTRFFTTDPTDIFEERGSLFFEQPIKAEKIEI